MESNVGEIIVKVKQILHLAFINNLVAGVSSVARSHLKKDFLVGVNLMESFRKADFFRSVLDRNMLVQHKKTEKSVVGEETILGKPIHHLITLLR